MIASIRSAALMALSYALLASPAAADAGMYGEADAMDMGMMEMEMDMCTTTIFEVGSNIPELSTLGTAIVAAGLEASVMDPAAEVTVLAPSNDAFAAIDPDTLAALLESPEDLSPILLLHAIEGQVLSEALTDGMVVPTLNGASLTVGVTEDFISFTSPSGVVAYVTSPDIVVCKSVIHVIDAVLLP